jgi:hypothetical protein
MAVKRDEK